MKFDENGVLLADVAPGGGVSVRRTGSAGGNKRHDNRSGKFTRGPAGPRKKVATAPPNEDPVAYARMLDAARDAARQLEGYDEGDIKEFVEGRANSPETVDIQAFMKAVDEQRKTDVVDLLDARLKSGGLKRRGQKITLKASTSYTRKLLRGLDTEAISEVMARLEAKGHDRTAIDRVFDGRQQGVEEAKAARPDNEKR